MRFLRTVSTQRLLAIIAGIIIAIGGGTAIAFGAASGGPVPPRESLATALHQAAGAPAVSGISARISFTNGLITSSNLQGSDPILNGTPTGRLWVSNDHRLRLELQGNNGDAQVVVNNGAFSVYDPLSNTVYKGSLPSSGNSGSSSGQSSATDTIPSVAQIQADLARLMQHWNVASPSPQNIAGQPAYRVEITPKHDGGLLGSVQLAWDAAHGIPLDVAIYAQGSNSPVLEMKATHITYGPVANSDLAIKAPNGAKVVQVSQPAHSASSTSRSTSKAKHGKHGAKSAKADGGQSDVTGPAAVQAHLPFTLAAPATLVGDARQSVKLLDWGGSPAALVTYGQGLGGYAVIEQSAPSSTSSQSQSQSQGGDKQGLSLPTVSINGASGQELATALGTVVRFSTGGVQYTVLGSVPPSAAELAAKALAP
jgi:outer membrane lipoprotein-sorting protein